MCFFDYDFLDRLTSVNGTYTQTYTYNSIGNILTMNGKSYSYDSSHPHAVEWVDTTGYEYDNNGNMKYRSSDNRTIEWDAENRPVSITVNGTEIASFVYDGDGNRIKKVEGGQEVLYINRYYEKDLTSGNETSHYYLGGRQVALKEGTVLRYMHQACPERRRRNHLTGTALMTSENGSSIGTIKFNPYGSARAGDVPTDKKFTGQRLDGTDLYYYGARYYDPEIGRFISPDTIIPNPANPQSFNRYSYCLNNPLKYVDPSGEVVEFVSGDTSISTELWYCDDPDIWVFVNDLIHNQNIMDELVEIASAWEEFEAEESYIANILEDSDTVFTARMNTGLLQIESQKNHNYVYIENGKIRENDKYTFSANQGDFVTHTYRNVERGVIIWASSLVGEVGTVFEIAGAAFIFSGGGIIPGLAIEAVGGSFSSWAMHILVNEIQEKKFPSPFETPGWLWNLFTGKK